MKGMTVRSFCDSDVLTQIAKHYEDVPEGAVVEYNDKEFTNYYGSFIEVCYKDHLYYTKKENVRQISSKEESEISWKKTYIKIAELMAEHSTCIRKHVGAVLVKDGRIISTGYNGVPSGMQHCCEIYRNVDMNNEINSSKHHEFSEQYEIHAEQNCIIYAGRNGANTEGAEMYVTLSPCMNCLKILVAAGIKTVYYKDLYDRMNEDVYSNTKLPIKVIKI